MATKGLFQTNKRKDSSGSGKLKNPGKKFFLELAAESIREFNRQRDANGISWSRKAMIRCGLALNCDGNWETSQLSNELQAIVQKYPEKFQDGYEYYKKNENSNNESEIDSEAYVGMGKSCILFMF
jgi:hypothetical protein